MMKNKFFNIIKYIIGILLIIAIIVVVIDPFTHYHMPFFGFDTVETDERSALVGVAKHATYDTALIGSSMSENFVDEWFQDGHFGTSCVKLCLQGAHFADYEIILDKVTDKPQVKNIVFSLDTYLLTNNPEENPVTIPEYLSNSNPIDDVYYLYNKSVLFEYIPRFIITNINEKYNDRNAYVWADEHEFSEYVARAVYMNQRPIAVSNEEVPYDKYFEYADEFLNGIKKYIEKRPDIKFYFYSSPYSMFFWDYSIRCNTAEAEVCALERVFKELLEYENVRIFYFQDQKDIVENLDNYRDYSHFSQEINYYMYECMRDGKCEVTKDTYFDRLLDMYNFALDYNYEQLFH